MERVRAEESVPCRGLGLRDGYVRVGSGIGRSGGSGVFMLNVVKSLSGTILLSVKKPRLVT